MPTTESKGIGHWMILQTDETVAYLIGIFRKFHQLASSDTCFFIGSFSIFQVPFDELLLIPPKEEEEEGDLVPRVLKEAKIL